MARINYISGKDSHEEEYFEMWLDELVDIGYIDKYEYQPEPFKLNDSVKYDITIQMKTKTKIKQQTLLQAREYTADYKIFWNEKAKFILFQNLGEMYNKRPMFIAQDNVTFVDVKGAHNTHSSWQIFEANRKSLWERYNIYVEKIQPIGKKKCLFGLTFTPKALPIWQKRDATKMYAWVKWQVKSIDEFVHNK